MTPTAAAAPPPPKDQTRIVMYDRLPWARIHPSKTNPRTHFDDAYIKDDLAVSIAEKGIIQPLVVRPHPKKDDDVEIVAGECRWRAAKVAGLELLPVIIREYTDEQVLEIQIEENTHRKDLTPLEEAPPIAG
jgi:ParB family chromosome partitioning protein